MRLRRPVSASQGEPMLPMINVVFLLLIFFMIAGAIERGDLFRVDPPETATGHPPDDASGVLLLAADGRLALDGVPVRREDLVRAVSTYRVEKPEAVLRLKADASVEAVRVVRLLEDLRTAGAEKVVLLATGEAP